MEPNPYLSVYILSLLLVLVCIIYPATTGGSGFKRIEWIMVGYVIVWTIGSLTTIIIILIWQMLYGFGLVSTPFPL